MCKLNSGNKTIFYIGIISIILSLGLSISWFLSVFNPQVMYIESYMGIIATFMGIAATLMLGLQIFNSIKFESKMKEIDDKLLKLDDVEQNKINVQAIDFFLRASILHTDKRYIEAFNTTLKSLSKYLIIPFCKENYVEINRNINNLCVNLHDFDLDKRYFKHENKFSDDAQAWIKKINKVYEEIQNTDSYFLIADKLNPIVDKAKNILEQFKNTGIKEISPEEKKEISNMRKKFGFKK